MMRLFALAALALLAVGCDRRADRPRVEQAWARLPAVTGRPGAAYFTLRGGPSSQRLIGIRSALVKRIELHASMAGMGGMTTMAPLPGIDLPAGGEMRLAPGGIHAMLFDIDPAITPGTEIPLRLDFADGTAIEASAKTIAAGDPAP